jgi:hypothetical protein
MPPHPGTPTRLLLLAAFGLGVALAAVPARAQTPCTGGVAAGYACDGVDLLARIPRTTFGSGDNAAVWGWTDPDTGREYAIVGNESGTGFVDVTDPVAPVYLGKMPTETFPTIWREMRVYDDHVFSVSDGAGNHGMQVMDLTRLRGVTSPQTFEPDHVYFGAPGHPIGSVHSISLDETSGLVSLNGTDDCAGGPHLVDVTDPLNPEFQGCYSDAGYSHDALCVRYGGPTPTTSGSTSASATRAVPTRASSSSTSPTPRTPPSSAAARTRARGTRTRGGSRRTSSTCSSTTRSTTSCPRRGAPSSWT